MSDKAQPNKMWSGRFRDPLNPAFEPPPWSERRLLLSYVVIHVAFCFGVSVSKLAAQQDGCTQQTINQLERESDNIHDWPALQVFFHRYAACRVEDAEVETGVSTFVTRMLTEHWDSLSIAAGLFRHDPPFETFALAGINITDATDDLKRIDNLAADHCPATLRGLCRKIRRSVQENN